MASSFDVFRKLLAPKNMEDMQRFTVLLNEAMETLYDKVFGYIELSDMAKATQRIIKSKTDAEAVQQIVDEATGEGSEIRQRIDSVSMSVTDLEGRTAAVETRAGDITQRVERDGRERSNVTQTPTKWEATVYREDDPANRNYIRFGRPVDIEHRDYDTQFRYWKCSDDDYRELIAVSDDVIGGRACFKVTNMGTTDVRVGCVADNSETVEGALNLGFKLYSETSYTTNVYMLAEDSSQMPVPLFRRTITAGEWNTIEIPQIAEDTETLITAGGQEMVYWFLVKGDATLYITDVFLEKADAAQTHAWSGWVHTPDDTSFRTFAIDRERMSADDETGTLGNVPSGATMPLSIGTTDWTGIGQATMTIPNLRDGMTVIVTPAPASIAECVRCNVRCTSQIGGNALVFNCDSIPTTQVTMNLVILAGLATWT